LNSSSFFQNFNLSNRLIFKKKGGGF
jgi:hypothetical protein